MNTLLPALFVSVLVFASPAVAQDLVYEPLNPSFGGNSFYSSHMLTKAQIQNGFKEEGDGFDPFERNALEDFSESLNRQILSQLSRQVISSTFGEDELEDGTYDLGDFTIDISQDADGVNINIFDARDGSETTIVVPYF
ncbi:MAG: curli production assembly/transport component CsgF [Ectothiorhodospiraceae bacterium]|nr:curli production assembly/transport component CsgF [Ectothiorhodospiraceae bacterium]